MYMLKKQQGFTMVELLITMVIFVLTIAAASNLFVGMLTQYKQQSKITETNIEGVIGLELLKGDIEKAGSGLPRVMNGVAYNEHAGGLFNDSPNPPRAVIFQDNPGGSDTLVIKATNIASNAVSDASGKFTYIMRGAAGALSIGTSIGPWNDTLGNAAPDENLVNGNSVIVLRPKTDLGLMVFVGNTTFNNDPNNVVWNNLRPTQNEETWLIYGIDNDGFYRMPFNRADYYLVMGTAPAQCAPGTGVLVKATISHNDGQRVETPILDCVADMQVVVGRDTNGDGNVESWLTAWPAGLNANTIRAQFKEVRVYILAHEGQRDTTYNFPNQIMNIVDPDVGVGLPLRIFDLGTLGATWNQYRWKIYTVSAKLKISR